MKNLKQKTVLFLNSIGIKTVRGKIPLRTFLPGIIIRKGTLTYNHKATVADLLHEAGHIALISSKYRKLCSGNMDKALDRIFNKADSKELEPWHQIYKQLIQSGEGEATAWAWAAGKYLNLPEEEIILSHTYDNTGKEIRKMLSANCYLGINGLIASGMIESVKTFPKLLRWTQP